MIGLLKGPRRVAEAAATATARAWLRRQEEESVQIDLEYSDCPPPSVWMRAERLRLTLAVFDGSVEERCGRLIDETVSHRPGYVDALIDEMSGEDRALAEACLAVEGEVRARGVEWPA